MINGMAGTVLCSLISGIIFPPLRFFSRRSTMSEYRPPQSEPTMEPNPNARTVTPMSNGL